MSYIVVNGRNYIARHYVDRFRAKDYLQKLRPVWGGRVTCTGALTFGTVAQATAYIERNCPGQGWEVWKYDPCSNAVLGKEESV